MPTVPPIKLIHSTQSGEIKVEYNILRKALLVFRALNHKLRQQIIKLLFENETLSVTEIYIKMRIEQSVASQHLAILRRAGILITQRTGKNINYKLNQDRLKEIGKMIDELNP